MIRALLGTSDRPSRLRLIVRAAKRTPAVVSEYARDATIYLQRSCTLGEWHRDQLRARITATYHNIEKGLSLPEPRVGFSGEEIRKLISHTRNYMDQFGPNDNAVLSARDALRAYVKMHNENGVSEYPHKEAIASLVAELSSDGRQFGGVRVVERQVIRNATFPVTDEFFFQRHSIREFSDEDVDMSDINAAIRVAQKAPVVCNRQSGAVHVIISPDVIRKTLEVQGGARGFGHGVNKLLVVTANLSNFWGPGERNQCWVDGGLFAMCLILGLHARGLGTCCLNWSKTHRQTECARSLLGLPKNEVIIMMIAVGHLPERVRVPFSNRKSPKELRRVIKGWSDCTDRHPTLGGEDN